MWLEILLLVLCLEDIFVNVLYPIPNLSPVRVLHDVVSGNLEIKFVREFAALRSFEFRPEVVDFTLELARVGDGGTGDARVLESRIFPSGGVCIVIDVEYATVGVNALFPAWIAGAKQCSC